MQKPGYNSLSFRTKVLIPVLAFLFLVPVVTLSIMQRRVSAQFERDAERKLKTAQRIFQSYLDRRSGFLQARYRNLVQEPRFRAVSKLIADTKDLAQVKPTVDDFLKRTFNDFNDDDAQVILFTSADDTSLPVRSLAIRLCMARIFIAPPSRSFKPRCAMAPPINWSSSNTAYTTPFQFR
jgi:hypothetical protein